MEKIKVIVENATGSSKREAELCSASGIISFQDGAFSHISRESKVYRVPAPEVKEEPVVEKVVSVEPVKDPGPAPKGKPGRPRKRD